MVKSLVLDRDDYDCVRVRVVVLPEGRNCRNGYRARRGGILVRWQGCRWIHGQVNRYQLVWLIVCLIGATMLLTF